MSILQKGYSTVNEILEKSSSISIGSNGGLGQTKSIFMRGTESNHTKVLINGGFFVLSPKVFELIKGDKTSWENGPLSKLSSLNQLKAYKHYGFWQPMDTLREKNLLQELWDSGDPPWKTW